MRSDSNTISVSLTVRNVGIDYVVTHSFEHEVTGGGSDQSEWRNRRIAAAIQKAVAKVYSDFGITDRHADLGAVGDFVSYPPKDAVTRQ